MSHRHRSPRSISVGTMVRPAKLRFILDEWLTCAIVVVLPRRYADASFFRIRSPPIAGGLGGHVPSESWNAGYCGSGLLVSAHPRPQVFLGDSLATDKQGRSARSCPKAFCRISCDSAVG